MGYKYFKLEGRTLPSSTMVAQYMYYLITYYLIYLSILFYFKFNYTNKPCCKDTKFISFEQGFYSNNY